MDHRLIVKFRIGLGNTFIKTKQIVEAYFLMKYAIVPPAQMVIVAYHFQVNKGLHRYKNVVINQRQTGMCGLYRQFLYFKNSSNVRT